MPVKQFVKKKNSWFEIYVKKNFDGKFDYTKIEKNIGEIEKKFKIDLSKNQKFIEFSVDSYNLISNLAKRNCSYLVRIQRDLKSLKFSLLAIGVLL